MRPCEEGKRIEGLAGRRMSRHEHGSNGEGDPPEVEAYGLVCALCERRLAGRFGTRSEADRAADEHSVDEHPGQEEVVILTAPAEILREDEQRVLERAREKQPEVDDPVENQGEPC